MNLMMMVMMMMMMIMMMLMLMLMMMMMTTTMMMMMMDDADADADAAGGGGGRGGGIHDIASAFLTRFGWRCDHLSSRSLIGVDAVTQCWMFQRQASGGFQDFPTFVMFFRVL